MTAFPAPTGYPYPQPTDSVLLGFVDPSFQQLRAMKRSTVGALIASDGSITMGYTTDGQPILEYAYGVAAADSADDSYGVMIAAFDNQAERRQFIIDNAAAWLV